MKTYSSAEQADLVAIIATKNRPQLLFQRALKSILLQTCQPGRIIVVEDRRGENPPSLIQPYLSKHYPSVEHLINRRVPGLSGTLNTGLDQCYRRTIGKRDLLVAVLDDDDSWEPNHLQVCLDTARKNNANMVVSGLIRHENLVGAGTPQPIPQFLDRRKLFIGGQNIQGSNLFVSLKMLLEAGVFDEGLMSCTDRDLCLRLAELPELCYATTNTHTVHHYADPRTDRLTTPGSEPKIKGLHAFFGKYSHQFDGEAKQQAQQRARELFAWTPLKKSTHVELVPLPVIQTGGKLRLLCGFVTDSTAPQHVTELLEDLLQLTIHTQVEDLEVVIVENGPIGVDKPRTLGHLVSQFKDRGLKANLISIEQIKADWAKGPIIDIPDPAKRRLEIAISRTVLNMYLLKQCQNHPQTAIWVLDDDKRLCSRAMIDGRIEYLPSPRIDELLALKGMGVDAVIGQDTDAAPLPFVATIRLQLLDLKHFLTRIANGLPEDVYALGHRSPFSASNPNPDSYYDLARSTIHLETPQDLPPEYNNKSYKTILSELAERVSRLMAGENIFRPLTLSTRELALDSASPSAQRGGSTIFFNQRLLATFPHTLSRIGENFVRRSDMVVTTLMNNHLGAHIVMHSSASVRHNRAWTSESAANDEVISADVLGYAFSRAIAELMNARGGKKMGEALINWSAEELERGAELTRKYTEERLAAFCMGAARIRGLCKAINGIVEDPTWTASTWSDPMCRKAFTQIRNHVLHILDEFSEEKIKSTSEQIYKRINRDLVRQALMSMDGLVDEYRRACASVSLPRPINANVREKLALSKLSLCGVNPSNLRLLGAGGEGIVFTDGVSVYKVFDLLKHRPGHNTQATLQKFLEIPAGFRHIYQLQEIRDLDGCLMVRYPYENSQPYTGGHGQDLVSLVRECKKLGITFRNMHPKNLRVTATGLKLIDYGSDIRPYNDEDFRSMAQRAWFTWRWHHRKDLDSLMRRALVDQSLPELSGFERFWQAVTDDRPVATEIVDNIVEPYLVQERVNKILDYGFGKKAWTSRNLALKGKEVVGYDPDGNLSHRWALLPEQTPCPKLTNSRTAALEAGPYDAVVCSLVLCEMDDGSKYEEALGDLRSACKDNGQIIITVCNPLSLHSGPTELHHVREIPEEKTYEDCFWYWESALGSDRRREFHRPLARLERDLLRHGISVEERVASRAIETDRFEPTSDFLTLVCKPIHLSDSSRKISLLIKTCAMEAETLERQVVHLLSQLEGPATFFERLLVVDSLQSGFLRQHNKGDYNSLLESANRLLKQGVIDRIITVPAPGSEASRINQDWFGESCTCTHSAIGAPLSAPLYGFECSRGSYILQVDSDLLIHRSERLHDYLLEMINLLEQNPAAITVALPIVSSQATEYTSHNGDKPWRVEARACLFHKERLFNARPFNNPQDVERLSLGWHRALDVSAQEGQILSLRGSSKGLGFIHPPNEFKSNRSEWMLMLDLVEKNPVPPQQFGQVNLVGTCLSWLPQERNERFVFLITGRNTPPERARRCIDSVLAQSRKDWGVVIVDDASSSSSRTALKLMASELGAKCTLVQPRERLGQMANMCLAIRHICENTDSIIITLDLDDELLGTGVLDRLNFEYEQGCDCTIGSMLRTDKDVHYCVQLENPRESRGGNVWLHLRSFRKYLFDSIPDHELRIDGCYPNLAVDWAFMLPIVEMASKPVWIKDPLYLYEPSGLGKGDQKALRECEIAAIVSKRSFKKRPPAYNLQEVFRHPDITAEKPALISKL